MTLRHKLWGRRRRLGTQTNTTSTETTWIWEILVLTIPHKRAISNYLFLIGMAVFFSCSKQVSLDIPEQKPAITIEGWIEQDRSARALITMSTDFETTIDSSSYLSIVQTKAKVWIETEQNREILTLIEDESYFPQHLYKTRRTLGEPDHTYSIFVTYDNDTTWATTRIASPIALDSVWFELEAGQDSLGIIWLKWQDPGESTDFYRLQSKTKGIDSRFIGCQISVLRDASFNGTATTFPIYKGYASLSEKLEDHRFKLGDTVTVKLSVIGEKEYEFWKAYDNAILNAGNPFSSGGENLPSNITGGFGIWTGYASYDTTIVCKKKSR